MARRAARGHDAGMDHTPAVLTVSPLVEADRDRWTELWRAYLAFYEKVLPDSTYDQTWKRILADREVHGLVARDAAGVVGITHFLFHAHCWTPAPSCYLQDLYVDAAARGLGAGRALIEAVGVRARDAGADRMYWMTNATNATARSLYDRLAIHRGFVKYEYALPAM